MNKIIFLPLCLASLVFITVGKECVAAPQNLQDPVPFVAFPLWCGDKACKFKYTKGAYTPRSVISVLDHHQTTPYSNEDGVVTAFTGEEGRGKASNQGCYPPTAQTGSKFSVAGLYIGTNDGCLPGQGLNYDSHPGYDYRAQSGTEVHAAAKGKVVTVINMVTGVSERCIPKGIDKKGCEVWGFIGIDHGNGYVTQYGHLSKIYFQSGDEVNSGDLIGLSGQSSPPGTKGCAPYLVCPHLHFEVLKKKAGLPYGYAFVDPYGWADNASEDPLERATGIPNIPLWKFDGLEPNLQQPTNKLPAGNGFEAAQRSLIPRQAIYSEVAFSGDSKWLVSTDGFELRVTDSETLEDIRVLQTARSKDNTGAGGPFFGTQDGRKLFAGGDGLTLWDTLAWKPSYHLQYPISGNKLFDSFTSLQLSLDEKNIISGSISCILRLIEPNSGQVTRITTVFSGQAFCGHAISEKAGLIASFELDKGGTEVRFSNLSSLLPAKKAINLAAGVRSAKFSPDGTILVMGLVNGEIVIWNINYGKVIRTIYFGKGPVDGIAFLPSGSHFAAASINEINVKIFGVSGGSNLTLPHAKNPFSWTLTISPNGKWLAVSEGKQVIIWNLEKLGFLTDQP